MTYKQEIKGINLLQARSASISETHGGIATDLSEIRQKLLNLDGAEAALSSTDVARRKAEILECEGISTPAMTTPLTEIFCEAEEKYVGHLGLADILSVQDFAEADTKVNAQIRAFNERNGLDGWDYAIAAGCGLFAAMLDLLCVSAPAKPTVAFTERVDGVFNRWVQEAFNGLIPPDLSEALSKGATVGAPDSSTMSSLVGAPDRALNPTNHRLRSLAHDPLLGLMFGVWDMMHGTCTTVVDGQILSITSTKGPTDGNVFELIGRMLGHLLSDMNAPSANNNRGMGLPAPFMGLLRMFEGISVGDSNFGRQIEWMYVNGYDFRQFTATSIPMVIMEALMRAFYTVKQMKLYGAKFGETLLDTMPARINPRFRLMLAMSYGTSSAVNAGKIYVTQNILNANYASWMGLAWNSFHALKWSLLDRNLTLWNEIEASEVAKLESLVETLGILEERAMRLPS